VELSPLSDVLQRWYTDRRYLGRDGKPKKLRYKGGQTSFSTLVKTCAGDLPVGAIKVELIRTGAVVVDSHGRLVAQRREAVPDSLDDAVISSIVFGLRALASTVAFNNDPRSEGRGRVERFAESNPLDDADVDEIRARLRARIIAFIEGIDNSFAEIPQSSQRSARRVGVGVYYYEDD